MFDQLNIAIAQLDFLVGDIKGNAEKHIQAARIAHAEFSSDLIIFPELSLTGYPPEDLLLRPAFLHEAEATFQMMREQIKNIYCLLGYPKLIHKNLYNHCAVIYNGKIIAEYSKQCLPNYGVFDEARYFVSGSKPCVFEVNGVKIGIVICEDLWKIKPCQAAVQNGAEIIVSPNASPFESDKFEQRLAILKKRAATNHVPIIYVNQVSGQDELIFDGGSMVVNAQGELCQLAPFFKEVILPVEITKNFRPNNIESHEMPNKIARIYQALVFSLKEYVHKNNFTDVLIGVSGGIDSALTLAIAVDALGKDHVHAVFMPSQFSAQISFEDAKQLAANLNVAYDEISIESVYQDFIKSLAPIFGNTKFNFTEENIQARCRAVILMALSNKFGYLVLPTSNRSELAVGYCTLYGDMVGSFAVLKDIPKTLVYELARYRNQIHADIPERILTRAPSAELAPNQKDEDTLPPYSILDPILEAYINKSEEIEQIVKEGFDRDLVEKIINMIHKSEYKRKQASIGPHINHKSFGKDWRYPITKKL